MHSNRWAAESMSCADDADELPVCSQLRTYCQDTQQIQHGRREVYMVFRCFLASSTYLEAGPVDALVVCLHAHEIDELLGQPQQRKRPQDDAVGPVEPGRLVRVLLQIAGADMRRLLICWTM